MTTSLDHRTPGAALHPGLADGDPVEPVLTAEELERVLAALKNDPVPAAGHPPTARGVAAVIYPTQEEGEPCSIP